MFRLLLWPHSAGRDRRLSCLSWKWRKRSSVKIRERTHEEATEHYTPEEKGAILRRHLVEGVTISHLYDELKLQPTVFYRWQKEFFENGNNGRISAFLGDRRRAAELFQQSWKNVRFESFGMIREAPAQNYRCFLTNFGSLLQTVMPGFTGI